MVVQIYVCKTFYQVYLTVYVVLIEKTTWLFLMNATGGDRKDKMDVGRSEPGNEWADECQLY